MNKSLVSVCVLFSRAATLIVEMKIIATIFVEPRHPEKKFCEHWGGAPGASSLGKTQDRVFSSAECEQVHVTARLPDRVVTVTPSRLPARPSLDRPFSALPLSLPPRPPPPPSCAATRCGRRWCSAARSRRRCSCRSPAPRGRPTWTRRCRHRRRRPWRRRGWGCLRRRWTRATTTTPRPTASSRCTRRAGPS